MSRRTDEIGFVIPGRVLGERDRVAEEQLGRHQRATQTIKSSSEDAAGVPTSSLKIGGSGPQPSRIITEATEALVAVAAQDATHSPGGMVVVDGRSLTIPLIRTADGADIVLGEQSLHLAPRQSVLLRATVGQRARPRAEASAIRRNRFTTVNARLAVSLTSFLDLSVAVIRPALCGTEPSIDALCIEWLTALDACLVTVDPAFAVLPAASNLLTSRRAIHLARIAVCGQVVPTDNAGRRSDRCDLIERAPIAEPLVMKAAQTTTRDVGARTVGLRACRHALQSNMSERQGKYT